MRTALLAAGLTALTLAACGDDPTPAPPADVATDAPGADPTDAGADTDPVDDAQADAPATPDVPSDPDPDADLDTAAAPDVTPDVTPDVPTVPPEAPGLLLTINELPPDLNGSVPWSDTSGALHPFTLRVNRANFTLDASRVGGGPVDWSTLAVTCDAPLRLPDGTLTPAGDPLTAAAFAETADPDHRRVHFTDPDAAPDATTVTCAADLSGPGGAASSAVTFEAATLPPALDPFATPDEWLVVLSRDLFALNVQPGPDGTKLVTSDHVPAGNGVPDFDEPFYELGLFSHDAPEATAAVKARLLATVRAHATRIFGLTADGAPQPGGVQLRLWFEGDPGAPSPADYPTGTLSLIALGGDGTPTDQATGIVGRAKIDWNNQEREDDSVYGLGVYPTALVRLVLQNPLAPLLLSSILPETGHPIGTLPEDAVFLDPAFDPAAGHPSEVLDRYEIYALAVDLLGLAMASTLCHEMGHSLGLVPYGPPPEGLFAEVNGPSFVVSPVPGAHIDTPGLNVMQTGAVTNWVEALSQVPTFNPLNLAYLRQRLVVGAP